MAGSIAEERIRAKAEAWLRDLCPEGRIIHELVMEQGGCRIDLAAVAPDRIIAIEIKSERDVLTRLPAQLFAAGKVVDHLFVAAAPCKVEKLLQQHDRYRCGYEVAQVEHPGGYRSTSHKLRPNPDYLGPWPRGVRMLRETDAGLEAVTEGVFAYPDSTAGHSPAVSPWDRLQMLWADELRGVVGYRQGARAHCAGVAAETMTGREVRHAVCAALRARSFPRADAPIHPPIKAAA